jgi:7-keto-8-aminopelargonate synthetase-like enzyme
MLNCPVRTFRHRNPGDLARQIKRCGKKAKLLVITDGMFSYNGIVAPLADYLKVLPANALLMVDDAHGAGTIGRTGRGSIEVAGVSRKQVLQTLTMSKALGTYGGAVVCSKELRERIVSHSHIYAGSTPLLLPLAYATRTSLRLLATDKGFRRRQENNARFVRDSLHEAGLEVPETPGPLIPIIPKDAAEVKRLHQELLRAGILPPFLNYPNGPLRGFFRFVISSEHTREQLKRIVPAVIRGRTG